jgi:hypothetical protein
MGSGHRWVSYAVTAGSQVAAATSKGAGQRPELDGVRRLAGRWMRRAARAARGDEGSVGHLLAGHLGPGMASLPVASSAWPRYEQVNVQAGLDAWLAQPGRDHEIAGLTQFHHSVFGLADLTESGPAAGGPGLGSVTTITLPAGPGGATRPGVQCALYLVTDPDGPLVLLIRGPEEHGPVAAVTVEVTCASHDRAQRVVAEIRRLAVEHSVYRGSVLAFGGEEFGHRHSALLSFLDRPYVPREQVILPPAVLDGIERQVIGVARHAPELLAGGQHLKRGVLLHGAPGTGKTHTVRYLLGQLTGVTVVVLSGGALHMIAEACSVARTLQPSLIVVEDVDLIAEERGQRMGQHPLLFQLLNEMDGLAPDLDVTFLLTTNRPDLLEPALAERPGRVDHAALLPLPDADARRRLLRLYQGTLDLDLADPETEITRTEGVTASFLKELLRRAALRAATEPGEALRVTDEHMTAALDELLDTRNQLTRVLLGAPSRPRGQRPGARPGGTSPGADAVIPDPSRLDQKWNPRR